MKCLAVIVTFFMIDAAARGQQVDAHTRPPQPKQEEIASIESKKMWEPVITRIVAEIRESLTDEESQRLRNYRIDIIPQWEPQGIHAHCSPNEKDPRICMTVGDIQGIDDLCIGIVLSFKMINDGDWMRRYCLLSRREFKRAKEEYLQVRVPSTTRAMGIAPDEIARNLVDESEVYHEEALRFILAHEVCHLLDRHEPGRLAGETEEDWLDRSQVQEDRADRFAIRFFQRQKRPPIAMTQVFVYWMILGDDGRFPRFQTHPLTHQRLLTIARMMKRHLDVYDLSPESKEYLIQATDGLYEMARMMRKSGETVFSDWEEEIKNLTFEDLRVSKG